MAKKHAPDKKLSTKAKKLTLPPDSAGKKMTAKIPVVTTKEKISDVRNLLFERTDEFETINYVYVVSKNKVLKGVISIADVFKHAPETPVKKVMKKKLVKTHMKTDQERAAHLALKEGIKALPVVNDNNHLLGVVPSDEIQKILDHESREDLLKLTGIIGKHQDSSSMTVFSSFATRVPWIVIGLLGGLVTASTISSFQNILEKNIILASFIPLIAYIANAVANQTQTILIKDLAIDTKMSFRGYFMKQLATATLIAAACSIFILAITSLIWGSPYLGAVVGLAMTAAILTATFFAVFIPRIMLLFNLDPAVGGVPFATVIQDFLSIVIYFSIASALL